VLSPPRWRSIHFPCRAGPEFKLHCKVLRRAILPWEGRFVCINDPTGARRRSDVCASTKPAHGSTGEACMPPPWHSPPVRWPAMAWRVRWSRAERPNDAAKLVTGALAKI
jgi:hypothetical protein